jgi:alcohol dehydrogenase class IV
VPTVTSRFAALHSYRPLVPDVVHSGAGALAQLPAALARLGAERVVVATTRSLDGSSVVADVVERLGPAVVATYGGSRQHSPASTVGELADVAETAGCDAVVSVGGGSVVDMAKAALHELARRTGAEVAPHVAVPTTLSAGEFTAAAGITDETLGRKDVTLDARLRPRAVILDPAATVLTPEQLWLSSGIKALEHAVEGVWALDAHPVSDALALEAVRLLVANLPSSRDPADLEARAACQVAAWMSITRGGGGVGIRLSHVLGHQIGARWQVPHGVTACVVLPTVMRYLAPATLEAQGRVAAALGVEGAGLSPEAVAAAGADRLESFVAGLGLPVRLGEAGGRRDDLEEVAAACVAEARHLGLSGDLPDGSDSVVRLLEAAW